jgi:hypothetical protein
MGGLAGVQALVGPDEQTLEAVYYDTEDLRLARAGVTLRRRRGGDDAGWHLKLPVGGNGRGGDSRDELRVSEARAGRRTPPAELVALVRALTRGAALASVAELTTARRRWRLTDTARHVLVEVVEVVDDHVSAHTLGRVHIGHVVAGRSRSSSAGTVTGTCWTGWSGDCSTLRCAAWTHGRSWPGCWVTGCRRRCRPRGRAASRRRVRWWGLSAGQADAIVWGDPAVARTSRRGAKDAGGHPTDAQRPAGLRQGRRPGAHPGADHRTEVAGRSPRRRPRPRGPARPVHLGGGEAAHRTGRGPGCGPTDPVLRRPRGRRADGADRRAGLRALPRAARRDRQAAGRPAADPPGPRPGARGSCPRWSAGHTDVSPRT